MTRQARSALPGRLRRIRILAPLGQSNFRLLWYGLVVSLIGDGVFLVAVAWQAYAVDNHPSALAAVGLSASLAQLALLLVGGAVSDRISRKTVLIVSDIARGGALVLLAVQGATGHLRLWQLCVAAAIIGGGTAFAAPAFDAIVPDLVSEEHLQHANGIDQVLRPVTLWLLGPALGGVLVAAAGASTAFAVDAGTFAFSAWCISRIVNLPAPAEDGDTGSLWTDLRQGISYVRRHTWLWGTFTAASLTYLLCLGPIQVLLPYVVKNELHGNAASLGLVLGTGGVGAIAAAAIVGGRHESRRPVTFMYLAWAGAALLVAGYGLATREWELAVTAFCLNALEAVGAVLWSTLKQRLVPRDLLGRVSSIDWFVSTGLMPVSFALTPLISNLLGPRTTLVAAGTLGPIMTMAFLLLPGMRAHDHIETATELATTELAPDPAPLVESAPAGKALLAPSADGRAQRSTRMREPTA